jgi:hypothetical protein
MSSEHITELLDDYLQALLSPESLRQVQGHLAKCSRCRIELAEHSISIEKSASVPD